MTDLPKQSHSFLYIGFLLAVLLTLAACASAPTPSANTRLTLVGEDSMLWLAQTLSATYSQLHPGVTFTIQVAHAEIGLRAPSEDPRTVGMVARPIKPNELIQTRALVVARDGVAVIVNQRNPINAIQRSQITQVFGGQIANWPTGPNAGQPIVVVSREDGSGTRSAFEAMVMDNRRVTLTSVVMPSEAAVVDYVAQHPDAIGYASMSALTQDVRALAVDETVLSPSTVESQKYPFVRTLAFVVPLEPDPELTAFVDFVTSTQGQAIIGERFGRAP